MKSWHLVLIASAIGGYLWYQNQEKDEIISGEVDLVEEVSPEGDEIEVDEEI